MAGEKIWISEATRKYGVSQRTLSRWVKAKYIERLDSDGYRVYLNEQDVAYCSAVYEERSGQGKRIFNKDGTPYKTKAELKAEEKEKED